VSSALIGFTGVGLRSCAEGRDLFRAVGYVEGWYVSENNRNQGIGAVLLKPAEDWACANGRTELASDSQLTNPVSQQLNQALGFQVVERNVNYRKTPKLACNRWPLDNLIDFYTLKTYCPSNQTGRAFTQI